MPMKNVEQTKNILKNIIKLLSNIIKFWNFFLNHYLDHPAFTNLSALPTALLYRVRLSFYFYWNESTKHWRW